MYRRPWTHFVDGINSIAAPSPNVNNVTVMMLQVLEEARWRATTRSGSLYTEINGVVTPSARERRVHA
jgi:hypothetical protein